MSRIVELDMLNRAIKDAEIRLGSVKSAVEQIDKEIASLTPRKEELERNLEFLKQSTTIPLAQEFKRTRAELSKTRIRLANITSDRTKANDAIIAITEIIAKFKKDYEEMIIKSENNILRGSFGGSNGKR